MSKANKDAQKKEHPEAAKAAATLARTATAVAWLAKSSHVKSVPKHLQEYVIDKVLCQHPNLARVL